MSFYFILPNYIRTVTATVAFVQYKCTNIEQSAKTRHIYKNRIACVLQSLFKRVDEENVFVIH